VAKKLYDKIEMRKWQYLFVISTQLLLISMQELIIGEHVNYLLIAIAAEMMIYIAYFGFPKRK
jgi:hypothetical protein